MHILPPQIEDRHQGPLQPFGTVNGQNLHPLARLGHIAGIGLAGEQLEPLQQALQGLGWAGGKVEKQSVHILSGTRFEKLVVGPARHKG